MNIYKHAVRFAPKPRSSVFICGCGHSGTTLLARILSTHPSVFSLPYETAAFVDSNGPKWKAVARLLAGAALSLKPVLVEKTPSHIHHTAAISRVLPRSSFIVATRDGRDTVASLGKRYKDHQRAFDRWVNDSRASRLRIAAGSSILWRYEDFIDSPSQSLARLCDFIGIAYSDELLDYHKRPVTWGSRQSTPSAHSELRNRQVNQPITDNRGKWKDELPADIAARFGEGEARELMSYFGYG